MKRNKYYLLSMKGSFYLEEIKKGNKKYEGRVYSETCRKMQVGDFLKLYEKEDNWGIECKIISIDVYKGFKEMPREKGILNLLPHLKNQKLSPKDLLNVAIKIYEAFKGSQRVHEFGAVAIGVEFIRNIEDMSFVHDKK